MNDENSELYQAMVKTGAKYMSEGPGNTGFVCTWFPSPEPKLQHLLSSER